MASISRPELFGRRALLRGALLAPVAGLISGSRSDATDYASAADVFAAIDGFEADVAARVRAIAAGLPGASAFAKSVLGAHERHRRDRAVLRKRLGIAAGPAPNEMVSEERDLQALRTAQEALVHAHAEGLPALNDETAVATLARHMVTLSRHLAIVDLWIEAEQSRG